ncbi:VOC family protein [Fictibacillus terranigra]|uniref:VOC family protein n=1 Tax=Fictibacillus terranigra TaxID=3058424 RepID=UPI003CD0C7AC
MNHTNPANELVFLDLEGEILLELVAGHDRQLAEEGKVNHVAFTVDDLPKEIMEVKKHSVRFAQDEVTSLRWFTVYFLLWS